MKQIDSAQNPQLKHLARLLGSAKTRRSEGQAVLEGVHLLEACLGGGIVPEQVFIPEHKTGLPEIRALTAKLPESLCTQVGGAALAKITSLTEADEVMTLFRLPENQAALPQQGDCVVLDRVQDPGNIGTILRSAAAAGVRTLILGEGCADVWSPKVLRAGMGAHFLLEIHERVDLLQWRRHYRAPLFATALGGRETVSLYQLDLRGASAWLFGNEGSGVSAELLAAADSGVLIPMAGATESLNVAMAATVCLFEQMRQRLPENLVQAGG